MAGTHEEFTEAHQYRDPEGPRRVRGNEERCCAQDARRSGILPGPLEVPRLVESICDPVEVGVRPGDLLDLAVDCRLPVDHHALRARQHIDRLFRPRQDLVSRREGAPGHFGHPLRRQISRVRVDETDRLGALELGRGVSCDQFVLRRDIQASSVQNDASGCGEVHFDWRERADGTFMSVVSISRIVKRASVALVALLLAAPLAAKTLHEQLEDGLYFVWYQTNRAVQGGVLFDTKKKNTRKLAKGTHKLCLAEGYAWLRFIPPAEIVRDEVLRAYWQMLADGEAVEQEPTAYGRTNVVRALVRFAVEQEDETWEKCAIPK